MKAADEVLLVVDVQNDFMPGGALAVPHGDEVVPVINRLARAFSHVVLTQDWHPKEHVSFAEHHAAALRSRRPRCNTASRSCGRRIACRAPRAPRCIAISTCRTHDW